MIAQYDNIVMSSFMLWFDHTLLDKGKAFTNTSSFFYDVDSLYNGYNTYGSPFRQFVADESIANKKNGGRKPDSEKFARGRARRGKSRSNGYSAGKNKSFSSSQNRSSGKPINRKKNTRNKRAS